MLTTHRAIGFNRDSKNVRVLKGGLKLEDTKLGSGKVATLGKRVLAPLPRATLLQS